MIRNVVLVKLKAEHDAAEVAEIQEGFRNLDCPGTLSYTIGDDLGLRDGTWNFASSPILRMRTLTVLTTRTRSTTGSGLGSPR